MARRHTEQTERNDTPTDQHREQRDPPISEDAKGDLTDGNPSRRSVLRLAGAAAISAGLGSTLGSERVAAQPSSGETIDSYLDTDSEVLIPPGTYQWNGSGFDIGSSGAVIGDGEPGSVVIELQDGTMAGSNRGRLENIVVRGQNPDSKAGIDVYPGCTFDGFIWPDGGQQDEDRAMYTPGGGNSSGRGTFRNSAWAQMVNNGAYVDKIPHTFENCASINNNISGIRVGHRELSSPLSETTYIRNCLVAVVNDIESDAETSSNARGIRLRHDAHLVIEDCYFIYKDVDGASYAIDIEDDCPDSVVEIRNCTFYNETDNPVIIDETNGSADVTVENCVVAGPGSHEVAVDGVASGAVTSADSVEIPTPSAVTGYAAADDVPGVEPGVAPWSGEAVDPPSAEPPSDEDVIVLHASPDNTEDIDISFLVDGEARYGDEAEGPSYPGTSDTIEPTEEGMLVTSVGLDPDALDSFRLTGPVVDYSVPDEATVDISWNGTTTTFAELVGDGGEEGEEEEEDEEDEQDDEQEQAEHDILLHASPDNPNDIDVSFLVDGNADYGDESEADTDLIESVDDGTLVTSVELNPDALDSYVLTGPVVDYSVPPQATVNVTFDGQETTFAELVDDDETGDETLPCRLHVDGRSTDDVTEYTFTVSGDVERDTDESMVVGNGTPWDEVTDIAREGKVIGLVGDGVDAYRFSGDVTALTVNGDAEISVEMGQ